MEIIGYIIFGAIIATYLGSIRCNSYDYQLNV